LSSLQYTYLFISLCISWSKITLVHAKNGICALTDFDIEKLVPFSILETCTSSIKSSITSQTSSLSLKSNTLFLKEDKGTLVL
jgi:hypothetical protein